MNPWNKTKINKNKQTNKKSAHNYCSSIVLSALHWPMCTANTVFSSFLNRCLQLMQRTHESVSDRPADSFQDSWISLHCNSSLPETTRRSGKEETHITAALAQSSTANAVHVSITWPKWWFAVKLLGGAQRAPHLSEMSIDTCYR